MAWLVSRHEEAEGDPARADLHGDGAVHERAGAALERRWADLIGSEDAGDAAAEDEPRFEAFACLEEREADAEVREIEAEMREKQLHARARACAYAIRRRMLARESPTSDTVMPMLERGPPTGANGSPTSVKALLRRARSSAWNVSARARSAKGRGAQRAGRAGPRASGIRARPALSRPRARALGIRSPHAAVGSRSNRRAADVAAVLSSRVGAVTFPVVLGGRLHRNEIGLPVNAGCPLTGARAT